MNSILAKKIEQSQKFLENGLRIPVTKLDTEGNVVVAIKSLDKNRYSAVQLGFDKRKKISPKSNKSAYRFLREVRIVDKDVVPAVGDIIKSSDIFKPGDIVNVTGISKGKGYAGGVKRYGFKGGPRTHGQSDRERAPGSIGTTTTPGRVLKGKRMAGRMGQDRVTIRNIRVVSVDDKHILVKGLVPGGRNNLLILKKVGVDAKAIPLYEEKVVEEVKESEKKKAEESKSAAPKESKNEKTKEGKAEAKEMKKEESEKAKEPEGEKIKVEKKEEVKENAK